MKFQQLPLAGRRQIDDGVKRILEYGYAQYGIRNISGIPFTTEKQMIFQDFSIKQKFTLICCFDFYKHVQIFI